MKWSETIRFNQPPREVCLLAEAPAQNWQELLRTQEQASYDRGRRDGETALNEQLVQQRAEVAQLQQGILSSLNQAIPQVIQETETGLIALAMEAARKVVAGMPITAELVESVVREALRQAEDSAEVVVQLHPDDLGLLRKQDAAILSGLPEGGAVRFIGSAEITRGGCLVQTRFGLVDARREAKLEQLTQTVKA